MSEMKVNIEGEMQLKSWLAAAGGVMQ